MNNINRVEIEGSVFIKNGHPLPVSEFSLDQADQGPRVYEVIRVLRGVPLFLEEHLTRLQDSISLLGHSHFVDVAKLKNQISELITLNQMGEMNFKILVTDLDSSQSNFYMFFIPSHYPAEAQYQQGVATILYKAVRKNPNIKAIAQSQRDELNRAIHQAGVYEALLVNENNEITEGSRSNLFFIKSDILYTAPSKDVLVGITRSRVMKLCNDLGIEVKEKPISIDFLKKIDGLFLTGTSPKVLPISSVDEQPFTSVENPMVQAIQRAYNELIEQYIMSSAHS